MGPVSRPRLLRQYRRESVSTCRSSDNGARGRRRHRTPHRIDPTPTARSSYTRLGRSDSAASNRPPPSPDGDGMTLRPCGLSRLPGFLAHAHTRKMSLLRVRVAKTVPSSERGTAMDSPGFEPGAFSLRRRRSTPDLRARVFSNGDGSLEDSVPSLVCATATGSSRSDSFSATAQLPHSHRSAQHDDTTVSTTQQFRRHSSLDDTVVSTTPQTRLSESRKRENPALARLSARLSLRGRSRC